MDYFDGQRPQGCWPIFPLAALAWVIVGIIAYAVRRIIIQ